jgi:hypothetical protein
MNVPIEYHFENTVIRNIVLLATKFTMVEQKLQRWKYGIICNVSSLWNAPGKAELPPAF